MKNIVPILFLLLVTGCYNTDRDIQKFKTIMLKSNGEVETLPNMATFHIDLTCLDMSVKRSKQCLVDKSNELTEKLLSFGIDKNDLLTTNIDLSKSYTWRNNSRIFQGYESSTSIFITVRNLYRLDEIYTELLENKNLDIGGLNYSHSKLDSLKNEAYTQALKNAGILADKLLSEMEESEKEILKVGNVELTASLPEKEETKFELDEEIASFASFSRSNNKAVSINKGTVNVNAVLFVEYQVK